MTATLKSVAETLQNVAGRLDGAAAKASADIEALLNDAGEIEATVSRIIRGLGAAHSAASWREAEEARIAAEEEALAAASEADPIPEPEDS